MWSVPSPELINALHEADSRITFFDCSPPTNPMQSFGEIEFYHQIALPLAEQVFRDFPGKKVIPARGTACSINGPIQYKDQYGDILIRDIRDIVNLGDEQARNWTRFGSVFLDSETGKIDMHNRVAQYLQATPNSLRLDLPPELAENIFPLLIIYDPNKIKGTLPPEKSSLITKAYILPYVSGNRF